MFFSIPRKQYQAHTLFILFNVDVHTADLSFIRNYLQMLFPILLCQSALKTFEMYVCPKRHLSRRRVLQLLVSPLHAGE